MKHLIIFGIILIGFILLKYSNIEPGRNSYISNNIYVKNSNLGGKYGRGIFANKNFKKGDIIELAPYIEDIDSNYKGVVRDYIFTKSNNISVLGLGYGSLYNHSDTPNAQWIIDETHIRFTAIEDINRDQEILVSYGNNYWNSRNLSKL